MDLNQKFAAIDIGSNAMRLLLARVEQGKMIILKTDREPVRLGADVFKDGLIKESTLVRSEKALQRFAEIIEKEEVSAYRAIGTSALREAKNQKEFIERIKSSTKLNLEVIDGEQEARLVYLAVSETVGFSAELDLLVDLGGGSVEITICRAGDILYSESIPMGTVRLINLLNADIRTPKAFARLVRAYSRIVRRKIQEQLGDEVVTRCVGTGGNLEAFLALSEKFFDRNGSAVLKDDLEDILDRLLELSVEERISQFALRADRADVIVPAAMVILQILWAANLNQIEVPGVGLREGIVFQLARGDPEANPCFNSKKLIQAALHLGRKYKFMESHAKKVADLALNIFDQTVELHTVGESGKKLLELAALLHDVGHFVSSRGHHKHSFYLIQSASFPALTSREKLMVACIARYHRKRFPQANHQGYADLSEGDRVLVNKLSAILRLADGLDRDQNQQVDVVKVEIAKEKKQLLLRLGGGQDLFLDTWSGKLKADLFSYVFSYEVQVVC